MACLINQVKVSSFYLFLIVLNLLILMDLIKFETPQKIDYNSGMVVYFVFYHRYYNFNGYKFPAWPNPAIPSVLKTS